MATSHMLTRNHQELPQSHPADSVARALFVVPPNHHLTRPPLGRSRWNPPEPEHGELGLRFLPTRPVVSFFSGLIHEDDGGRVLTGHDEKLSHHSAAWRARRQPAVAHSTARHPGPGLRQCTSGQAHHQKHG